MNLEFKLEEIKQIFAEESKLATHFANYEYRPEQQQMAEEVAKAFRDNNHALIEAGTGTGKSLAYLIPAICWALSKEEKAVVSTNTINLQEQLIEKDIPLLKEALAWEFDAILMKGRRNYLCLRRLWQAENSNELNTAKYNDLRNLNQWLIKSSTGCKSDLDFILESKIWDEVCSESELCLRGRCPHYGKCFFIGARNQAREADLLIVNHHLLFADLALRSDSQIEDQDLILPAYDKLIFDEAHNIEDVATAYLGFNFKQNNIVKKLKSLYNKKEKKGLALKLRQANHSLAESFRREFVDLIDNELITTSNKLIETGQSFFNQLSSYLEEQKRRKLRLTPEQRDKKAWQKLTELQVDNLLVMLNNLTNQLKRTVNLFTSATKLDEELNDLVVNTEASWLYFTELRHQIDEFFNSFTTEYIYWLEDNKSLNFKSAPLDVGEELYNNLLCNKETVVFTSATLTVQDSFDFIKNNLGLNYEQIKTLKLGSPFNYAKQLKIGIANDLLAPNKPGFMRQIIDFIKKIITLQQGKSLILFTSYRMLDQVYESLNNDLENLAIKNLYCQGKGSRNYLLNSFKKSQDSVLLGTDSFWEGVDIPGDKLSNVIIVKLPFLVPSEPVTAARIEKLEEQGLNSFMNYMLPRAVIKLRQGVGRLIRTKTDQGWVIILDNRILRRRYGKVFLDSLPINSNFISGNQQDLFKKIKNYS